MASTENAVVDNSTPTINTEKPTLLDAFSSKFGRFFNVFSSAAAISTFLVFAGFLSDYGAYSLAGLPRLSMTITGLVEQGADMMIDSFALLAGGSRFFVLLLALTATLIVWVKHDSGKLQYLAKSLSLYRACRFLLLILSILMFSALVERTQRTLSGTDYTKEATEYALSVAYSSDFPDPGERQIAIERLTYELPKYMPLDRAARLEQELTRMRNSISIKLGIGIASASDASEPAGIPLRFLEQARTEARHVFGWLILSVLLLATALALVNWWGTWLMQEDTDQAQSTELNEVEDGNTINASPSATPTTLDKPRRDLLNRLIDIFLIDMSSPLQRLVVPLTLLLTSLTIALLPLAHGILARTTIGAETVLVLLTDVPKSQPAEPTVVSNSQPNPTQPGQAKDKHKDDRTQCSARTNETIDSSVKMLQQRARDYLQIRPSREREHKKAYGEYATAIDGLVKVIEESHCADAMKIFWSARPSRGIAAIAPELADVFQRALQKLSTVYKIRVGTILAYPREGQPLTLVNTLVPKPAKLGGQPSIVSLAAASVESSVVLPNLRERRLDTVKQLLGAKPDHDALEELLYVPDTESLAETINLLMQHRLFSNGAGVSVTAIGSKALAAVAEKPDLSTSAIDVLADLVSFSDSKFWPNKSDDIRGAAATSLHLTRNPYAGYKFVMALRDDPPNAECGVNSTLRRTPLKCIEQTTTTAGYLMQDILAEMQRFKAGHQPKPLTDVRDRLAEFLIDVMLRKNVRDDVRGAACSALSFAGFISPSEALKKVFWDEIVQRPFLEVPFSAAACLNAAIYLGIDENMLKPHLRKIALEPADRSGTKEEESRLATTAIISLHKLGIANEDEFVFQLYSGKNAQLAELAEKVMDEVDADRLAKRLIVCASDTSKEAGARNRCLEGLTKTKDGFDGDDGTANAVYTLAAQSSAISGAACRVLNVFNERGSKWISRREDDDVIQHCQKALKSDSTSKEDTMRQLMELLKGASGS